jgi:hypothetical protein
MIARANAREILAALEEIRVVIFAAVDGRLSVNAAAKLALAAVVEGPVEAAPIERPSARYRRQNAEALVIMAELEGQGRGRSAAVTAARRLADDPHDPTEVERLSQRFRRHRRTRK